MKDLREELERYLPYNEQEAQDKAELLEWMDTGLDLWTRENGFAHFTASAWVTDPTRTQILMCWHNIYHSWSWLGGHADGDHDLLHVAEKEVMEESGLSCVRPLSEEIFSIEILTVDGHVKRGKYVSSHLHLNITYLLEADPAAPLSSRPEENKAVAWFEKQKAVEMSTEPWFQEHIYTKLNEKLERFRQQGPGYRERSAR